MITVTRPEMDEARDKLEGALVLLVQYTRLQLELQERANSVEDVAFNEHTVAAEREALSRMSGIAHDLARQTLTSILDHHTPPSPRFENTGLPQDLGAR